MKYLFLFLVTLILLGCTVAVMNKEGREGPIFVQEFPEYNAVCFYIVGQALDCKSYKELESER